MNKFEHHLFATIYFADDCPDGDVTFVSDDYKEWADKFEIWKDTNEEFNEWSSKLERQDHSDYISFGYDQQTIWFSANPNICPWGNQIISTWHKGYTGNKHEN